MDWGVKTAKIDLFKDRINPDVVHSLDQWETALIGYSLASNYSTTKNIAVPFSFSVYEKKLEPFMFEFVRVFFPDLFKRFVEKKMHEAEEFMTDPDAIDKEAEAIEEAELYLINVIPNRLSRSHYDVRKGVILKRDRLVERAEQLLAGIFSCITLEDVWLFDIHQARREGMFRLVSNSRLDHLPDILKVTLRGGKDPEHDPAYGITDAYRLREEDRLAYLMGLAEGRARKLAK
jgi:hypothetical protein